MDLLVIPTRFHPKTLLRVGFGQAKLAGHFIQIIGDSHDLPIGNAHEFVGIARLRLTLGFQIYLAGKVTVDVYHGSGG